ncbi:hypothetical protein HPG69_002862 [Diceros bicornis minor]|uniref:G-protein coupled receptors family 3 profile domain-containing protein n=1 Tax=Diceros bicornis minor TaxID=77932 RepID=A0A7J7EQZ7_DICBM|nr:hypothetical protein HPG69_002862 [Diceros bicornis minor]
MKQCAKCPDNQYPHSDQDHYLSKVVTFVAYENPVGMVLACAALCLSVLTAVVLGIFVKCRDTPIVKANHQALSYILSDPPVIVHNKGSVNMFYLFLRYLGSLALVSFTLAFWARSLPDTFSEAKSLTFSIAGLLGWMFAPKCCNILLKPDRNTLAGLKGKTIFEG